MIRTYKSIWNRLLGTCVAVAETVKSRGSASRTGTGALAIGVAALFAPADAALAEETEEGEAANTVIIGTGANPGTGAGTIVVGENAVFNNTGDGGIVIGRNAKVESGLKYPEVYGIGSIAIGTKSHTYGNQSVSLGMEARTGNSRSVAVGAASSAAGEQSTAVGNVARTTQIGATALGAMASSLGLRATSVGSSSNATGTQSTALGTAATATAANSVALGAGSVADRTNTVSVGNETTQRQVTNVAKGTSATDAANVAQLNAVTATIGAGAAMTANGDVTLPSFRVGTDTYGSVGAAVEALDAGTKTNTTLINEINNGTAGLVQQDPLTQTLTVGRTTNGTTVDFTGSDGARRLTGLRNGLLSAASTDAITGAQLHATHEQVATNTTNIENNTSQINEINTSITNITNGTAGLVTQDATTKRLSVGRATDGTAIDFAGTAGMRTLTGVRAGALSANSTEAVNGAQLHATNQQVALNTTEIGEISSVIDNLYNGTAGLVQQDADSRDITLGKDTDGTRVNLSGTAGARQLDGVAAGSISANSLFAVNGSQLYGASLATASALGGGSTVDANGAITAPSYSVGGTTVNNIGAAVGNLDARVTSVETTVNAFNNQIDNGEMGLVRQDADTGNILVAADKGGNAVDVSGTDGSRKMTGVADGAIAAGSTDAVNGGQIYALTEQMGTLSTATAYFAADGASDGSDLAKAAAGTHGVAAGSSASATGNNSVAVGSGASAAASNGIALGAGATAIGSNSVAIGADSVADRADTVSVGAAGAERQIANVAAGTAPTDAVNVSQLEDYGRGAAAQANAYTDRQITDSRQDANGGIASAMAMAGLPQATLPGKGMVALSGSTYDGETAMALGVSKMSKSGRWVYKAVASTNTRGHVGAAVGAGFHW